MKKTKKPTKEQRKYGKVYIPVTGHTFDDKQKYLLNFIYLRRHLNFEKEASLFVNVNAATLEKMIGRYQDTKRFLLKEKILVEDKHYVPGVSSRAYAFAEDYEFVVDYIKEKGILRKIKEKRKENKSDEVHISFLERNLKKVTVDLEEAEDILNNKIDYKRIVLTKAEKKLTKKMRKKTFFSTEETLKKLYRESIMLINDKVFQFPKRKETGRQFTNITNLKRELRGALRYNGQRIYELDCANSQNFLFNIIIRKFFVENSAEVIFEILKPQNANSNDNSLIFYSLFSSIVFFKQHVDYILSYDRRRIAKTDVTSLNTGIYINSEEIKNLTDIVHYFDLTRLGKYWAFMMKADNYDEDKSEYKQKSFEKVFFSKLPKIRISKYRKTFKKHFPNVLKIIDYYKRESHKNVPIMMQKAESEIIIDIIVKRIHRKHPRMFILTIHDAIASTKGNLKYIKSEMLDSFQWKHKFKPTIKDPQIR